MMILDDLVTNCVHVVLFIVYISRLFQLCDTLSFLPYGDLEGDSETPVEDGGFALLNIPASFKFYGDSFDELYVNNDGLISFNSALMINDIQSSFPLSSNKALICLFCADIDITKGGKVYYSIRSDPETRNTIKNNLIVYDQFPASFNPVWVFVATWENVKSWANDPSEGTGNTFQVILATDSDTSAVIFLYQDINWILDSINNYPDDPIVIRAKAGFNAGDATRYQLHTDSTTEMMLNITQDSNINEPGQFIYRVDTTVADVTLPVTTTEAGVTATGATATGASGVMGSTGVTGATSAIATDPTTSTSSAASTTAVASTATPITSTSQSTNVDLTSASTSQLTTVSDITGTTDITKETSTMPTNPTSPSAAATFTTTIVASTSASKLPTSQLTFSTSSPSLSTTLFSTIEPTTSKVSEESLTTTAGVTTESSRSTEITGSPTATRGASSNTNQSTYPKDPNKLLTVHYALMGTAGGVLALTAGVFIYLYFRFKKRNKALMEGKQNRKKILVSEADPDHTISNGGNTIPTEFKIPRPKLSHNSIHPI